MQNYRIKQKINQTEIPPNNYFEFEERSNSSVSIVQKDGKYGIVAEEVRVLLPFEYDNISMAGGSLFLLVQNGKMGLAHIERSGVATIEPFELKAVIPCEYDFISFPQNGESFVMMRKDQLICSSIFIYFCLTNEIHGPFWRATYYDRDFVVVIHDESKKTEEIFFRDGRKLFAAKQDNTNLGVCGVYETSVGTVFVVMKTDLSADLILIKRKTDKEGQVEVERCYCEKFIGVIPLGIPMFTETRRSAVAFVDQRDDEYLVLGEDLRELCHECFTELTIRTVVGGMTNMCVPIMLEMCPISSRKLQEHERKNLYRMYSDII